MAAGRRAEQQRLNRERILAAARDEFAEVGYRAAKIDGIAARAALTRGAVYSNFPGKRALGLTVAAGLLAPIDARPAVAASRDALVTSLAKTWLARLPLSGNETAGHLDQLADDLYSEIRADRDLRDACAELLKLDAIILGTALRRLGSAGSGDRDVRAAAALLNVLHGAGRLSAIAPGFTDPFDVVAACSALAATDFGDRWTPPHASIIPTVETMPGGWTPSGGRNLITRASVAWPDRCLVVFTGLRRASTVEQALRAVPQRFPVVMVLVTDDPAERFPLATLVLGELFENLRPGLPADVLADLAIVVDHDHRLARDAGLRAVTDDTCLAMRVDAGRILARAEGPAAGHAVAARIATDSPEGRTGPPTTAS